MAGIRIRHRILRSCLALVPIASKPFFGESLYECPFCHVVHPVKTVHLWLDDTGSVTVSKGVFEDMRNGWSGPPEYDIVGEIKDPPPLNLNGGPREKQDQEAQRLTFYRWKE